MTAAGTSADDLLRLRRALSKASVDRSAAPFREALFIGGFEVADASAWNAIEAVRLGAVGLP